MPLAVPFTIFSRVLADKGGFPCSLARRSSSEPFGKYWYTYNSQNSWMQNGQQSRQLDVQRTTAGYTEGNSLDSWMYRGQQSRQRQLGAQRTTDTTAGCTENRHNSCVRREQTQSWMHRGLPTQQLDTQRTTNTTAGCTENNRHNSRIHNGR